MKFDFCIGNPPYQETRETTKDMPLYNDFMDAAYMVAGKVELITPARFLFNAGATPKEWNRKMLDDEHFKILEYEPDSSKVFSNTDIKGGVAVSYRDSEKKFGAIETFSAYPELNTIRMKVVSNSHFSSLSSIMFSPAAFRFTDKMHKDHPEVKYHEIDGVPAGLLSKGNDYMIATNVFEKLDHLFFEKRPESDSDYVGIWGLLKSKRQLRYIRKEYVSDSGNLNNYKIILPKSNGSGALGEVFSTPLIGLPLIGHTQSFISIGSLDTEQEAEACLKYVKSKFARTMLGLLKITQDNPPTKWKFVPLQDFTSSSDIDWSRSVADIDRQLYRKYGLSEKEIEFIETHVKEMI